MSQPARWVRSATGSESQTPTRPDESFGILSQYEQTPHRIEEGRKGGGTVIAINDESVFLDICFKTEGIIPPRSRAPVKR
jgi:hypothetical protein